jgi:hypothetical protein
VDVQHIQISHRHHDQEPVESRDNRNGVTKAADVRIIGHRLLSNCAYYVETSKQAKIGLKILSGSYESVAQCL